MADYRDVLGLQAKQAGVAPKKQQAERMKRPEGMSREAFALLGDSSHPIMSAQELMPKKKAKPKPSTKGIVAWQFRHFKSSARADGLALKRWERGYKDAAGRLKEQEPEDYPFARFNKKVHMMKYDDEEYETLVRPISGDWSREETDYLMGLCERFDLRFLVIADRYERTIEDIKARYYSIARRLLVAREGGEAPVANEVLVRHPYNKEQDVERKRGIEIMQARTRAQLEDENAIIAEARQIEEERRAEAEAAAAAAAAAMAPPAPAAVAASLAGAPSGGVQAAAGGGGVRPAGGAECLRFPAVFPADPGPGMPSLLNADLQPVKPPPGVYPRGVHALGAANAAMGSLPGGQKAHKAVEQLLGELGWQGAVTGPKVATRPVCAAWLALRAEVVALQDLKRSVAGRYGEGGGGDKKSKKRR